jgi:two-component system response regulator
MVNQSSMTSNKIILLVEDNPDDVKLTIRAFRKQGIACQIDVACDGVEALEYLFGKNGDSSARPLPDLVLMDLNMPRINGLETLRKIRSEERTRYLPVVVLTTSQEEKDLQESYRLGANSYLCKPVDYSEFTESVGRVGYYWLMLNLFPYSRAFNV